MIANNPVVSSIRSRHTGHVGSSTRFGVGGGNGLDVSPAARDGVSTGELVAGRGAVGLGPKAGVNGSLVLAGKLEGSWRPAVK
jgi:hypothetical protein